MGRLQQPARCPLAAAGALRAVQRGPAWHSIPSALGTCRCLSSGAHHDKRARQQKRHRRKHPHAAEHDPGINVNVAAVARQRER